MNKNICCDLAIIGGGAGGLSVAAGAAQLGVNVVLFEGAKMGGDCLNSGCVPSKALLSAAKAKYQCDHAVNLGIHTDSVTVNFEEVMQHVHGVIKTIEKNDSVERFEGFGVKVIEHTAKFINKNTLEARGQQVRAKHIVIATGSSAFVPPIVGIDTVNYFTNETIFELKELPEHLIVIGGGPIGCELAQAFVMLGSKVTILEGIKILPKDEPDCVEIVRNKLIEMGISLHEAVNVSSVEKVEKGIKVIAEHNNKHIETTGSHLLVATGRRANVNSLNLEAADIDYTPQGIKVDARLRTNNKKIFAIGDVVGPYQFTHVAGYHASIIIRNILFKQRAKVDYRAVPWVTYTKPELAHVGLTFEEAKKQFSDAYTIDWPFEESDRAQAEGDTTGKIRVITNKKGQVLGVTIVGEGAGDLLQAWIPVVKERKSFKSFTDIIVPYPTRGEISKRVAGQYYTPILFSKKTRFLVKLLKWI